MRYLFIYLFIYLSINAFAQEMVIDWNECFGGSNTWSISKCIDILPNENVVTSVSVSDENSAYTNYHGGADSWVLVIDENGNLIQDRCFGGSGGDIFRDIEVFNTFIYFIGFTNSIDGDVQSEPNGGYEDLWVVKTDFDLNIIWERRYGSIGIQDFHKAKVTPEGGLLLLMDFFSQGGGDVSEYYGNTDIWVCEIDANGDIIWETTLGNAYGTFAGDVIQTQDGKIIVLGEMDIGGGMVCEGHNNDGTRDIWVIALDEMGELLWQNCYGGSEWEMGIGIIEDNGGYTIVGITESHNGDVSYNHGGGDLWMFHIDNTGTLLWEKSFGGSSNDSGRQVYKTEDDGYFLFGSSRSKNGDVNHLHCPDDQVCLTNTWVLELNANRDIIWNRTYGPIGYSYHTDNAVKRIGERDFMIAGIIGDLDNHSGDVDCEPYPINSGKSAWIYRLRDCASQLEESIPDKPIGDDTICTVNTTQSIYTTQIQYSNYEDIEWVIEPQDAADIIAQDTSLTVNWRPYFEGQVSLKARTTSNCGESEYSDSLLIQVNTCLSAPYLQTRKLKTYPNPAKNYIVFELPQNTKESPLIITDIYGKTIAELDINGKTQSSAEDRQSIQWNCQTVTAGVYFYQTEIGGVVYRGKIVIQQ